MDTKKNHDFSCAQKSQISDKIERNDIVAVLLNRAYWNLYHEIRCNRIEKEHYAKQTIRKNL
jgi:hypothetical protein